MIVAEKHGTVRKNRCFRGENGAVPQIDFNIYGNDLVGKLQTSNNQRYYYLKDHLGSIRVTLDQSGNIDSWTDYYPFGKQSRGSSSVSAPKEKFTGKERDAESGLDYFGARYYNPEIVRWTTIDPLWEKHRDWNPYNYVLANPIILVDPDGRQVYFNRGGQYIGSASGSDQLKVVNAPFTASDFEKYGAKAIDGLSKDITYDEAGSSQTLRDMAESGGNEAKAWGQLNAETGEFSLQVQPTQKGDGPHGNSMKTQGYTQGEVSWAVPDGQESNQVIMVQAHSHTGGIGTSRGVSGGDIDAAKKLGRPVIAVDKKGIHIAKPKVESRRISHMVRR